VFCPWWQFEDARPTEQVEKAVVTVESTLQKWYGAEKLAASSFFDNPTLLILVSDHHFDRSTQVRKTPSWPRSWANFSIL
jgi:hypothetical protein